MSQSAWSMTATLCRKTCTAGKGRSSMAPSTWRVTCCGKPRRSAGSSCNSMACQTGRIAGKFPRPRSPLRSPPTRRRSWRFGKASASRRSPVSSGTPTHCSPGCQARLCVCMARCGFLPKARREKPNACSSSRNSSPTGWPHTHSCFQENLIPPADASGKK
jgi:hypothetical protein